MPWLTTVTTVGVVVLAALIWLFIQTRSKDLLEEILAKQRSTAKAATRAEFLEGPNRIPVALCVMADRVAYVNPDLDAFLDMKNIDEVEYDDETSTGRSVHGRVLRLRSHGHAFEFELDAQGAKLCEAALPAKRMSEHRAAV